ncbi:DUF1849 family protein [Roseibium denhamense]|uniref:DUF1849 family protein n=1 Tax=Roseibium denhamense TaxID=76305 RepID=A0ABY1NT47_9HYPH|nr:cell envelope integrity EipB family protein [Roseibium denhamense]MTI05373.1 DUF1849 family protein [Roseibium denhamense]SMP17449.1 protein of unknown function [Roseibium denhamense]
MVFFASPGLAAPGSTSSISLAPHRAVYDLRLGESAEQSGVAGVKGRMVYDFSGSACDGYSVNFRFVTEYQDMDGGAQVRDLQSSTFEEPGSASFQFLSKTYVDQKLLEETKGIARSQDNSKQVELQIPAEKTVEFGKEVLFPTEHLLTVLTAAKEDKSFLAADIYDGSETGEKSYATTTVIGARAFAGDEPKPADGPDSMLAGVGYWPMTIAYFDPQGAAAGELTPIYQLSFRLYENGISSHLTLDYGDFTLKGKMTDLEMFEAADCP